MLNVYVSELAALRGTGYPSRFTPLLQAGRVNGESRQDTAWCRSIGGGGPLGGGRGFFTAPPRWAGLAGETRLLTGGLGWRLLRCLAALVLCGAWYAAAVGVVYYVVFWFEPGDYVVERFPGVAVGAAGVHV